MKTKLTKHLNISIRLAGFMAMLFCLPLCLQANSPEGNIDPASDNAVMTVRGKARKIRWVQRNCSKFDTKHRLLSKVLSKYVQCCHLCRLKPSLFICRFATIRNVKMCLTSLTIFSKPLLNLIMPLVWMEMLALIRRSSMSFARSPAESPISRMVVITDLYRGKCMRISSIYGRLKWARPGLVRWRS